MDIDRTLDIDDAERVRKALYSAGFHRATAELCSTATIRDLAWVLGGASAVNRKRVLHLITTAVGRVA